MNDDFMCQDLCRALSIWLSKFGIPREPNHTPPPTNMEN